MGVHINVKETFALHEVLRLLVAQYPDRLSGTTLELNVGNTTMFHAFRKGRAGDECMREPIKSLFFVTSRLLFHSRAKVDMLRRHQRRERPNSTGSGRKCTIRATMFRPLMERVGGFDMNLMATGTSVQ